MASAWEQRWAEFVRRMAGLRESTSLELLPDLMPVLQVVDPSEPELHLYRRERLAQGWYIEVAGGAGVYSYLELCNPAGSGSLVVVDTMELQSAAVLSWDLFDSVPIGTVRANKSYTDARAVASSAGAITTQPVAELRTGNTAAIATLRVGHTFVAPATPTRYDAELVLPPGWRLYVSAQTLNTQVAGRFRWRERPCDPSELRL